MLPKNNQTVLMIAWKRKGNFADPKGHNFPSRRIVEHSSTTTSPPRTVYKTELIYQTVYTFFFAQLLNKK